VLPLHHQARRGQGSPGLGRGQGRKMSVPWCSHRNDLTQRCGCEPLTWRLLRPLIFGRIAWPANALAMRRSKLRYPPRVVRTSRLECSHSGENTGADNEPGFVVFAGCRSCAVCLAGNLLPQSSCFTLHSFSRAKCRFMAERNARESIREQSPGPTDRGPRRVRTGRTPGDARDGPRPHP
jgi:hypothetical protein